MRKQEIESGIREVPPKCQQGAFRQKARKKINESWWKDWLLRGLGQIEDLSCCPEAPAPCPLADEQPVGGWSKESDDGDRQERVMRNLWELLRYISQRRGKRLLTPILDILYIG